MSPLRVAMIGAFKPDYPRNHSLHVGLERNGVEVILAAAPVQTRTGARLLHVLRHISTLRQCDVILIPTFNQLLAPFIWALSRLFNKPVLLDYMVGLTDLMEDRGAVSPLKAAVYRWIDRFNLSRMTSITDTQAHCETFRALLGRDFPKLRVVPVGVRDDPPALPLPPSNDRLLVQYVGTYIPFHSVDVILRAAHLLREDNRIAFELIGRGQTYAQSVALAEELGLENVTFTRGYFSTDELLSKLEYGTILLGVFGDAAKTAYVIPNKVYDALALGRPLITATSPALEEYFVPGEHYVSIPPGDPESLALAIRELADSPEERERLRIAGQVRIQEAFLPRHIGAQVKTMIEELLV